MVIIIFADFNISKQIIQEYYNVYLLYIYSYMIEKKILL